MNHAQLIALDARFQLGAPLDSPYDALASCLGNWLEWLEFNLRRSLHLEGDPNEQALANHEIETTLALLQTLWDNLSLLVAWMEM